MIPVDLLDTITTGDARDIAARIPDGSVDLVFTDPTYDRLDDYRWLAEMAARVLRPGGSVLAFSAQHKVLTNGAAMLGSGLLACPVLEHYVTGPRGCLHYYRTQCNIIPAIWLSKGRPSNVYMAQQIVSVIGVIGRRGHKWGKSLSMILARIEAFTVPGSIVCDPFVGGGTTSAACKMLGRHYIASEIDPGTADLARARVLSTPTPLFITEPEQLPLL